MSNKRPKSETPIPSLYENDVAFIHAFKKNIHLANDPQTRAEFETWMRSEEVRCKVIQTCRIDVNGFPLHMTNVTYLVAPLWVAYHNTLEVLKHGNIELPNEFLTVDQ